MFCDNDWTVRFPTVNSGDPFEVRPASMTTSWGRRRLDYAEVEMPEGVAEMMKPETRDKDGKLREEQPVDLCIDGDPVRRLLFQPERAMYTNGEAHLTLVDIQYVMNDGIVDNRDAIIRVEDAYNYAFDRVESEYLTDIEFDLPDTVPETVRGGAARGFTGGITNAIREHTGWGKENPQYLDTKWAIDWDRISPFQAIWDLNNNINVYSWVEGTTLKIGLPELRPNTYLAAPNDDRVWRYTNVSVRHPNKPIQRVVVQGQWITDDDMSSLDFLARMFSEPDEDTDPFTVRMEGVAERSDINYGRTITLNESDAQKGGVQNAARLELYRRMSKNRNGTVQLDPALSGDDYGNPAELQPGDYLRVVPDDSHYTFGNPLSDNAGRNIQDAIDDWNEEIATAGEIGDPKPLGMPEWCNPVNNELYLVTGVEHSVLKAGGWQVNVDVALYPDSPIDTYFRYFNPRNGEYIDESDVTNPDT